MNIEDSAPEQLIVLLPSLEDLHMQFEGLRYHSKETLKPHDPTSIFSIPREGEEAMMQFLSEMIFVNRLNTIAVNKEWVLGHSYSPFKARMFKEKLTNPKTECNEFGQVDKWGMKMALPGEWDLYEKFYNEIFEHTLIDDKEDRDSAV